jgi:hypothetical protein
LALDCTYYLRQDVEELRSEETEMRKILLPTDTFIYAAAVFPSLPGEYKLPWASGTLTVENRVERNGWFTPDTVLP